MATLYFEGRNMIVDQIKLAIESEVYALGYDYLEVHFLKENGNDVLRIIVDKDEPTSLEDIIKVNDVVSPIVDNLDLIKGRYMLDVTTLGVEKPIKVENFDRYIGKYIAIHLTNPYKGENNLEGYLLEVNEETITLELRDKARKIKAQINKKEIDKARLAIKL